MDRTPPRRRRSWRHCRGWADRWTASRRLSSRRPDRSAAAPPASWHDLGARVAVGSRRLDRAHEVAGAIREATGSDITPFAADAMAEVLRDRAVVVAAGTTGVTLLPASVWQSLPDLKVLIDLNAVPPLGIEGIEANDKGAERGHARAWGALGVGGMKMKIHKRAIQELFASNDKVLDAEEVLELGRSLG